MVFVDSLMKIFRTELTPSLSGYKFSKTRTKNDSMAKVLDLILL